MSAKVEKKTMQSWSFLMYHNSMSQSVLFLLIPEHFAIELIFLLLIDHTVYPNRVILKS